MANDPFDVDQLRLTEGYLDKFPESKKPPRHRPGEKFIKGPLPWAWFEKAARLPGKALAVGLCLWQEAGWRKTKTLHFCLSHGERLGADRHASRRALKALEGAGLVTITQRPGCCPDVTLLEVTAE